jgi:hypothetical protein
MTAQVAMSRDARTLVCPTVRMASDVWVSEPSGTPYVRKNERAADIQRSTALLLQAWQARCGRSDGVAQVQRERHSVMS